MKTKTNRLLSLLLTLTMVLGMLPAMSLTAFAAEPGISITGSTADSSGTGWSYVKSTKTLTLSGYNGGYIQGSGLSTLNLVLEGTSTITVNDANAKGIALDNNQNLNISGSGSLTINATGGSNLIYGIECNKFTMTSGTVTINANSSKMVYGVNANDSLSVTGGKLTANITGTSDGRGLYCKTGKLTVGSGAEVDVTVTNNGSNIMYGIYNEAYTASVTDNGDIELAGTVTITRDGGSTGSGNVYGIANGGSGGNTDGVISITGGSVTVTNANYGIIAFTKGHDAAFADVDISGGTVNVTSTTSDSLGIVSWNNGVTISGGTVTAGTANKALWLVDSDSANKTGLVKITGDAKVSLTSTDYKALIVQGDESNTSTRVHQINLTSGGSVTVKSTSSEESYYAFPVQGYFNLGSSTKITEGSLRSTADGINAGGGKLFQSDNSTKQVVVAYGTLYTGAGAVSVNGHSFASDKLYYKNGGADTTDDSTDYNAHYDPATGVLELKDYNSGPIIIGGSNAYDLTVKLTGTNTVTTSAPIGGVGNVCVGINITNADNVTFIGDGTLTVNTNAGSGLTQVFGIWLDRSAAAAENLTFQSGKVTVNVTATDTAAQVFGVSTAKSTMGGPITVAEGAELNVTLSSASTGLANGLLSKGNITLNGKTAITLTYTGSGSPNASNWSSVSGFLVGNKLNVGANAAITVDMPDTYSLTNGMGSAYYAAKSDSKIEDEDWTNAAASEQYFENDSFLVTQSVQSGLGYADYKYEVITPLTFEDKADYDIPAGTKGTGYTATVALTATGGSGEYRYEFEGTKPSDLSINAENKLVYTRSSLCDATTATVKVTDKGGISKSITISIGAVTAPSGTGTVPHIENKTVSVGTAVTVPWPEGATAYQRFEGSTQVGSGDKSGYPDGMYIPAQSTAVTKTYKFKVSFPGGWVESNEFTVTWTAAETYSATVDNVTCTGKTEGYDLVDSDYITIKNTGTGALKIDENCVTLTGAGAANFTLTCGTLPSTGELAGGATTTAWRVKPVIGLSAGTYTATIQFKDLEGKVTVTGTVSFTVTASGGVTKLDKPTNLVWDGTTAKWDAVTGADKYRVILYASTSGSGGSTLIFNSDIAANSKDFSEYMLPGMYYSFEVAAYNSANYSGTFSGFDSSAKKQMPGSIGTVTGFAWSGNTISWNAVTDATGYDVWVMKDGVQKGSVRNVSGTSLDLTSDFESGGEGTYYVSVSAYKLARGNYLAKGNSPAKIIGATPIYSAAVRNVSVNGTIGTAITETQVVIDLTNDTFVSALSGNWITNLPAGLSQSVSYGGTTMAIITISGTPTAASTEQIAITIPADQLIVNTTGFAVTANANAKFNIMSPATYTVSFDANGGTGTMADVTGVSGEYTLPANGFTAPAGKQFKGWSTGATGAVIAGTTYNVTGDVTLYAIWEDKPHTHTYSTAWSTDETNHWHECTCGDKKDVAAHTPGAAATETTPQTCTICGYVIKAALGHTHNFNQKNTSETYLKSAATCTKKAVYYYSCTCGEKGTETFESGETAPHSYSTEWSSDETNHWHKCANCDAVADKAAHRYDNACDTTCNDCGKTREITHSYSEVWSSDETNHWHECSVCGDKKDVAAHTPGAAATETTPQTCTICGYVIKAALGHTHNFNQKNTSETYLKSAATCTKKAVYYYSCTCGEKGTETFESGETAPHSYSTEWSSDETNHWHKCANCDAVADKAAHRYDNACDTTCNDCGKTRETSHSFGKEWYKNSEKHWHECSVCHTKKDEAAHIYDNACDKDCNICGQTREVTHSYSEVWSYDETNHWHECSVCHTKKDETPHTYDNACDTTCNDCGKTREITHSYSEVWSNDETNHWHECSVCHAKKDEAAHTPGAEATETTAQVCTVCGYVIKAPLGHTHRPTIVKRVEPTCEKAGNIEHYKCSCGKLYYDAAATKEITNAAKIILSATGHTRGGDWKSSEIYHWHECAVCGERMDTAFHRAGAEATETTPQTCAVCGYVIKEALGHTHSFTEKNTDAKYLKSAATCSASAEYYYSCSCGEKGTETFKSGEKLAHNFKTEWSSNGEKHWHECSLCGEKKEESSHSFEWKIDKAATATEAGSKHEECTVCGFKKDAVTIEPTGTTTTTPAQTTTGGTTETPEKSGNAWILIAVAGVVVLGGGAAAAVVAVKKKKEN